jgi:hypothetical protein
LLLPALANRHGLQADGKGDLSGLAAAGQEKAEFSERRELLGLEPATFTPCTVEFWDVLGDQGHPLRATISELNEQLPEVGDAEKPKLLMRFGEAHLLFAGAPPLQVDRCWLRR